LSEEPPQARYTTSLTEEFTPYFTAIGRLAIIWAEFEFSINEAIWELANVERFAGTCMTSQMIGPGPRFRCFVSLLRLRNCPAELINKINSLSNVAEVWADNGTVFFTIRLRLIRPTKLFVVWKRQQIGLCATQWCP
jgi:hypothetical protein